MKLTVVGESVHVWGRSMPDLEVELAAGDVAGTGQRLEPHFEVHRVEPGRFALSFWGRFPAGWCGALSLSLSQAGLAVLRGFAKKVREKAWVAEFEIESTRQGVAVESLDFVAMAVSSARAPGLRRLALSEFNVEEPERHEGSIYLEVRGRDQVGFLAELLGQLAFLSFFPEEMIVQTTGDQVFDRFLLKGLGGQAPAPGASVALSRWLEGLKTT